MENGRDGATEYAMSDEKNDDPLSTGAALDVLSAVSSDRPGLLDGRRLGDYRVVGLIAEGGMGRVYRAVRIDGSFDRDVAIKLSPDSSLSQELRERFLREQGVLATLNHPNICQLYDAGLTEEGWPYIVMELIEGVPVDQYCSGLEPEAVTALMMEIADALAYAHARLIVHRDIKPSNVLVTADGRPKLLDFGIAKLLEPDVTALTRVSPMTPRYASPEQLLGEPVTIGSDIYQLGLLLWQMLTGEALQPERTLAAAIQQAVAKMPLALPSEPRRRLPRELVLIVEQCLRLSPSERYSDANALKRDLAAWRNGYPLSAAGQSAFYRFRKLLARNRATASTAGLAVVALVAGASWYTWQLNEARAAAEREAQAAARQAERAGRISDFLVSVMAAPSPENARGETVTARDLLDRGVERLAEELHGDRGVRSSLLVTMAASYKSLGDYERAASLVDEALALGETDGLSEPARRARALLERGNIERLIADNERALATLEEALAEARAAAGDESLRLQGEILDGLGVVAANLERLDAAREYYRDALSVRSGLLGPDHVDTLTTVANLGGILVLQESYEEALPLYERAVAATERTLGPDHPNLPPLLDQLAVIHRNSGRIDEALAVTRRSVELARRLYGPDHPEVAFTLSGLAILHGRRGDYAAAADVTRQVVEILVAAVGDDNEQTAFNRMRLANYALRLEHYGEAEQLLEKIRPVFAESSAARPSYRATFALVAARLYARTDRLAAAVAEYQRVADLRAEFLGHAHPGVAEPLLECAGAQASQGDLQGAAVSHERALDILAAALGESHPDVLQQMGALAAALDNAGRSSDAGEVRARIAALETDSE